MAGLAVSFSSSATSATASWATSRPGLPGLDGRGARGRPAQPAGAGLALVAIGAASNLLAIVASGGYMPADPGPSRRSATRSAGYSNSVVTADPALRSLTDIFALPAWLPFANVFSIGDVLIGVGIAVAIATGMRRGASLEGAPGPVR
jgi:hypothetical protein